MCSENDRETPPFGFPSARPASSPGQRAPHATLEVNALVALEDSVQNPAESSEHPTPLPLSARTTRILGSMPEPPVLAPSSRRSPSGGASDSSTRYRYVSTPPPPDSPGSARPSVRPSAPPPASASLDRPPRPAKPTIIPSSPPIVTRAPTQPWRPDLSLLPESRRNLSDELYPLAVDGCWVVGVLATEGAEARSRLAAEIALVLAESGHPRVLLIDADFKSTLVRRFLRAEMPLAASFSEQLKARGAHPWTVVECLPSLHVLAESEHVAHGSIAAEPLAACLGELRAFYDFVVIDGPLLDDVAACEAVRDVVDGVVFSHGRYGPSELTRVRSLFPSKRISLVPAVG